MFAMVVDRLLDKVRDECPWTMKFTDDIVIFSESMERVEESLEWWKYALERRVIIVNRSNTEYMC